MEIYNYVFARLHGPSSTIADCIIGVEEESVIHDELLAEYSTMPTSWIAMLLVISETSTPHIGMHTTGYHEITT